MRALSLQHIERTAGTVQEEHMMGYDFWLAKCSRQKKYIREVRYTERKRREQTWEETAMERLIERENTEKMRVQHRHFSLSDTLARRNWEERRFTADKQRRGHLGDDRSGDSNGKKEGNANREDTTESNRPSRTEFTRENRADHELMSKLCSHDKRNVKRGLASLEIAHKVRAGGVNENDKAWEHDRENRTWANAPTARERGRKTL